MEINSIRRGHIHIQNNRFEGKGFHNFLKPKA